MGWENILIIFILKKKNKDLQVIFVFKIFFIQLEGLIFKYMLFVEWGFMVLCLRGNMRVGDFLFLNN